jgi:hypothetical protein
MGKPLFPSRLSRRFFAAHCRRILCGGAILILIGIENGASRAVKRETARKARLFHRRVPAS